MIEELYLVPAVCRREEDTAEHGGFRLIDATRCAPRSRIGGNRIPGCALADRVHEGSAIGIGGGECISAIRDTNGAATEVPIAATILVKTDVHIDGGRGGAVVDIGAETDEERDMIPAVSAVERFAGAFVIVTAACIHGIRSATHPLVDLNASVGSLRRHGMRGEM